MIAVMTVMMITAGKANGNEKNRLNKRVVSYGECRKVPGLPGPFF